MGYITNLNWLARFLPWTVDSMTREKTAKESFIDDTVETRCLRMCWTFWKIMKPKLRLQSLNVCFIVSEVFGILDLSYKAHYKQLSFSNKNISCLFVSLPHVSPVNQKNINTKSPTTLTGHEHDVKLVGSERQCSDVKIADLTSSAIPEPLTLKLETDASREYLGTNAADRFIVDGAGWQKVGQDKWQI